MAPLIRIVVLAVAIGLATAALGWWVVPMIGAAWGFVATAETRPVVTAAAAAALAWGALLGWTALRGPAGKLAATAAPILGLPDDWMLFAVTLLYPALLAAAAATVAIAIKR